MKNIRVFLKKLNLCWAPENYTPLYSMDDLIKDMAFTEGRTGVQC